jgi:hypothetical protein
MSDCLPLKNPPSKSYIGRHISRRTCRWLLGLATLAHFSQIRADAFSMWVLAEEDQSQSIVVQKGQSVEIQVQGLWAMHRRLRPAGPEGHPGTQAGWIFLNMPGAAPQRVLDGFKWTPPADGRAFFTVLRAPFKTWEAWGSLRFKISGATIAPAAAIPPAAGPDPWLNLSEPSGAGLSQEEEAILRYVNMARVDPARFAREYFPEETETVQSMSGLRPMAPLSVSSVLMKSARAYAKEQQGGAQGHQGYGGSPRQRIAAFAGGRDPGLWSPENLAYGSGDVADRALFLVKGFLIDRKNQSGNWPGHRYAILDSKAVFTGIAVGPHARGIVCVQHFAGAGFPR